MLIRANAVAGALDTILSTEATTMESAGLADLPAVSAPDFARVTIYRRDLVTRRITAMEIVHVTEHTAGATTATITRGQEGTDPVTWLAGEGWDHAPTVAELDDLIGRAAAMHVVAHGASTTVARPPSAPGVLWRGSAAPANAVDGDLWDDEQATSDAGGLWLRTEGAWARGGVWQSSDLVVEVTTLHRADTEVLIPISVGVDVEVDWGDGETTSHTASNPTHTYAANGVYQVRAKGKAGRIGATLDARWQETVRAVESWGRALGLTSLDGALRGSTLPVRVPSWIPATVTSLANLFRDAAAADPDVSRWNTVNVTNMARMFLSASAANPDVSRWRVRNVTDFSFMFQLAAAAKPDVRGWDTRSAVNLGQMFRHAALADPDVSGWDVRNVTDATNMLHGTAFSDENYDKALLAWSQLALQSNVAFHAGTAKYTEAAARDVLVTTYGWTITDGGVNSDPLFQRTLQGESSPAWMDGQEYATFDPRYLPGGGLLMEGGSENEAQHSERYSDAYWSKLGVTVLAEHAAGPTSAVATLADKLTEVDGVSGVKGIRSPVDSMSDTDRTYTVYAKADGRDLIYLSPNTNSDGALFDLAAGTVSDISANVETATIEAVGNGWYRCRVTVLTGGVQNRASVYLRADAASSSYVGVADQGVLLWGLQAEPHRYATSYIPTTTTVPRKRVYEDYIFFDHGMSALEGTVEVRFKISDKKPNPGVIGNAQCVFQFAHNYDEIRTVDQTPRMFMYWNFYPNHENAPTGLRLRCQDSEETRIEYGDHVNNVLYENEPDPNGLDPFEELLVQLKWKEGNDPFYEVWINGFLAGQSDTADTNPSLSGEKPIQWPQAMGADSLGPLFIAGRPLGGGVERAWSLNGEILEMRLSPIWRTDFPDFAQPLPNDDDTLHLFTWDGSLDPQ